MKCTTCGHHGEHACPGKMSPCCASSPSLIVWDAENTGVRCRACGTRYRAEASALEGTEPFLLLALSDTLTLLSERLELKLSDSAMVCYMQACMDALDDEDEKRIIRAAIDVIAENWRVTP